MSTAREDDTPEQVPYAFDEQTTRAAANADAIGESTAWEDDTPERGSVSGQ